MDSAIAAERLRVGTAGWSYPDWVGPVYPAGRSIDRLRFIGRYVDCIELNNSFYRIPGERLVRGWAERVADLPRFFFTVKVWRGITHERTAGDDAVRRFIDAFRPLEESGRIGAWLLQFPWSFRRNDAARELLDRLARLFERRPTAVELRHGSWNDDEARRFVADRDLALCDIDQPVIGDSMPPTGLVTTPRLGYMRLHGRNRANWFRRDAGRDERYDYLYDETELGEWRDRALAALPRVERLFVVLNNHFRGQALANALQIGSMIDGRRRAAPPSLLEMYPALRGISSTPGQGNLLNGK